MVDGLISNPERKAELESEAIQYNGIMTNSYLYKATNTVIISSCIAHEVAQSILHYSLGLKDMNMESHHL